MFPENRLCIGDCLNVLRDLNRGGGGFIDLVYIDPPFNSKRDYNMPIEREDGGHAQALAFEDTWERRDYGEALEDVKSRNPALGEFVQYHEQVFRDLGAAAYLTTMAARILEMHVALKNTGAFYLHCDPTMSHSLKLLCDAVFGRGNFRSEIVWKRTSAHSSAKRWAPVHDTILFYTKSDKYTWNSGHTPYDPEYIRKNYNNKDEHGHYMLDKLMAPGVTKSGDSGQPWRGIDPNQAGAGHHWAAPDIVVALVGENKASKMTTREKLDALDERGYIHWPQKEGGKPRLKRYLDQKKGVAFSDMITDISPLSASQRMGYPTEKPGGLLERIVGASSNKGDLVADFFCGCGTTISIAQKLNRRWLGCDISSEAIQVIKNRLKRDHGRKAKYVEVGGFPVDLNGAIALFEQSPLEFEKWVVEHKLGARRNDRTPQGGYDGYLRYYLDANAKRDGKTALIEVKGGQTGIGDLRSFQAVVDKMPAAEIGVFVCFEKRKTAGMVRSADDEGRIDPGSVPRLQILTVEELLQGKKIALPNGSWWPD